MEEGRAACGIAVSNCATHNPTVAGDSVPRTPWDIYKKKECAGWNSSSVQLELERVLAILEGAEKIRDVGVIDGLA